MADRLDISEECQRLKAHISAFTKDFQSSEPIGKRMGFLLQEMNRKPTPSDQNPTTRYFAFVGEAQGIYEKIREQIQNIE